MDLQSQGYTNGTQNFSTGNSSDNEIFTSVEKEATAVIVVVSIIPSIIILTGIIGNISVIWVIATYSTMRQSVMNMYILNMAIADLILNLLGLPEVVQMALNRGWLLGEPACKAMRYIMVCSLYVSILSLLAVSVERFVAIVYPMQAHILLTRRRIVIALSTIWLLSTSLAVPVAVFDRTRRMGDEKVYCVLSLANTYDAHIVRWRIYKYLEFLILFLCPLIVQVVLYIRIQGKLRENTFQFDSKAVDNKNRNGNENENQTCRSNNTIKSRQRVIRMLTICVVIYFISFTPAQILLIYDTIASKPFHQTWLFRTFMLTLVFMNSAANPVIYCLCSETYRARFGVMYGCIKERERRMEQRSARGSTLRSVSSRTQSLRLTVQTSEDKPEVCQLEPVNENDILLPEA